MLAGAAERHRTVGRSFKAGMRSGVTSGKNRAEQITDFDRQSSSGDEKCEEATGQQHHS